MLSTFLNILYLILLILITSNNLIKNQSIYYNINKESIFPSQNMIIYKNKNEEKLDNKKIRKFNSRKSLL